MSTFGNAHEEVVLREIEVFRYRLPFTRPTRLGDSVADHRDGICIRASDGEAYGWGDAAPLPGFSAESPEMVAQSLLELRRRLPLQAASAFRDLESPSARFALDTALRELVARGRGEESLLPTEARRRNRLEVASLVDDQPAPRPEELRLKSRVVKVKVGAADWQDDARRVLELRAVGGTATRIRLDANRRWSVEQAVGFMHEIADAQVEFIEEPVGSPATLQALADGGIPIALDETLHELARGCSDEAVVVDRVLERIPFASVLVVKPAILGRWRFTLELIDSAERAGLRTVLSSSYESGIGLRAISAIAAAGASDEAVGFDTYGRLSRDLLIPPLRLDSNGIDVEDACSLRREVDVSLLESLSE